jgi:hypothetical protein
MAKCTLSENTSFFSRFRISMTYEHRQANADLGLSRIQHRAHTKCMRTSYA